MSGLGDALQGVGGMLMDMGKEKRLEKLRKEKEASDRDWQVQSEKRAEAREDVKIDPSQTRMYKTADGVWMERLANSKGGFIDERPADQYKIEQAERDRKKEDVSLETALLTQRKLRREEGYADEDRAREIRYDEARIGATERSNYPSPRGRSVEETIQPTEEQTRAVLRDENKTIADQLQLTPAQYEDILSKTIGRMKQNNRPLASYNKGVREALLYLSKNPDKLKAFTGQ